MAASFYSNSVHVDFESALAIGEPEISEKLFVETFDLPVDGLANISEMPKDKIFDARSIVSLTGDPVTLSGLKIQMKMHYRLLCDIMAKSISVKAGSFNAITVEKFSLLTAMVCDVQMNWGRVLFGFLKKMVTPGMKQAKGFAIQISLLLESVPNLELGASSEFPSSKILTDKTIHRYIAVIDKSGAQEPVDAPKVKKAPKTKVASRKRPADIPLDVPVVKRKRTSKKKSTLKLVAVAQEAIPIQIVPAESAVEPMVEDQQTETEDAADRPAAEEETPADRPANEIVNVEQRVDELAVEVSGVDVVDPETVIQQVLNQLDFITEGQDVAKGDRVGTWFDRALAEEIATASDESPTEKVNDEEIPWFVRPFLSADHDNTRLFETGSDSADAMDFEVHSQNLPVVRDPNVDPAAEQEIPVLGEQLVDSVNEEEMQDENVQSAEAKIDKDEAMSLDDLILSIPAAIPLPSASIEITKIKMGTKIQIPGFDEKLCYLASLPQITADDKGKELLVEKDPVKGHPAREHYFSICANIDLLVKLREQIIEEVIKRLTRAQREAANIRRSFDDAAEHYSELERRLAEMEVARAEEMRATEIHKAALETRGLRLEAERAALLSEKRALEIEREAMKAELDETKARAAEEAERMRGEVANAWALGKEEFLQSSEFEFVCTKKSVAYFNSGFEGAVAQFRANGYLEEEHPSPFLDAKKALRDMPEDEEEAAEEEDEEEEEEEGDATPRAPLGLSRFYILQCTVTFVVQ
ncbi:hypothetical protein F511_13313 [Dorcoceras hygrometricum]|uniref:Dystroglycan-like n=1 Tax=Dorcoceras hygrometricum TaxID=472368 RepID=A0A2Z7DD66_9LAMI|nr:hypothetical protein F511_13313 [Dorcoceras hygrometricum]